MVPGRRPATPGRPKEDKVYLANSYPTHPIGPIAQWMDINRGNRFDYLVSMSADGTRGNRSADINTSLIRTVHGQTITLYFDTKLPRPYDLIYRARARGASRMASSDKIYIEGAARNPIPGSRWKLITRSLSIRSGNRWGRKPGNEAGTGAATGW